MAEKRIYIICGERSGDLHASNLVAEVLRQDDKVRFRGMGGDYCEKAGVDLAVNYNAVALMGFLEVLLGFRKVLKYLKLVKKDILQYKPDMIVLVDYGGFNMKIAEFASSQNIPVHYYIPPKVWAWNQKRALKLKAYTDQIYSILPFERAFFQKYGMDVAFVGNPLLDEIKKFKPHEFFFQKNELNFKPIVALLPGSRKQEIQAMLARMLKVSKNFEQIQFVVAGVKSLEPEVYQEAVDAGLKVVFDQTYDLLHHALAAVVTSGTATLETALFRVPQVVVYRTSTVTYEIAKRLVKIDFISLVNLIAGREVVKELIQDDFSVEQLTKELQQLMGNQVYKGLMLQGYDDIGEKLGQQSASETTARLLLQAVKK